MFKAPYIIIVSALVLAFLVGCQPPTDAPTPAANSSSQPTAYPAGGTNPTPDASRPGYPAPAATQASAYPSPASGVLQVNSQSGQAKSLAAADLSALTKASVESQTGPKMMDVLSLAGIQDFAGITVTGSNGSMELAKDKITDQVIIALDNNTFTLVMGGTPKEQWIKDVSSITVK